MTLSEYPRVNETITKQELLKIAEAKLVLVKEDNERRKAEHEKALKAWRKNMKKRLGEITSVLETRFVENPYVVLEKFKPPYFWDNTWAISDQEFYISALKTLPDGPVHHLLREVLRMSYDSSRPDVI